MKQIKYYRIYDPRGFSCFDFDSDKNFEFKENALNYIENNHQFKPSFYLSELHQPYFYETKEEITKVYQTYLAGPKKGQIKLDKDGRTIVKNEIKNSFQVKNAKWVDCNIHKSCFEKQLNRSYEGYFEFCFENINTKRTEDGIQYSADVYVVFSIVNLIFTPEIKVPGQPYQAPSKKIDIIETEKFQLFVADGKYGINDKIDNWFRSKPVQVINGINIEEIIVDLE